MAMEGFFRGLFQSLAGGPRLLSLAGRETGGQRGCAGGVALVPRPGAPLIIFTLVFLLEVGAIVSFIALVVT